ncbi:hypothetical protein D9M68_590080 [compost metagenome]
MRQCGFDAFEPGGQCLALLREHGGVLRGLVAPQVGEDGRAEFHPCAMLRTCERVFGVQAGAGLRLLEVFADHVALEQHGLGAVGALHLQQRHLAQRRDVEKPLGLVREIDHDALEGHVLLVQRDRGALHVGAQQVADEGEGLGHGAFRFRRVGVRIAAILAGLNNLFWKSPFGRRPVATAWERGTRRPQV